MELYGIVYKPTGRMMYIGITSTTAVRRFQKHVEGCKAEAPRTYLHRAMKKHGCEHYEVRTLAKSPSWESLVQMEKDAIFEYGTFWEDGGYNLTYGGEGVYGHKHSPEVLQRMAAASLGRLHTEEAKQKIAEASKGHPGAMKGKNHTEEAKAKLSAYFSGENHPMYGKPRSEETKEKQRQKMLGRQPTEETREKLRAAKVGVPKSEAHRQALSAAKLGKTFSEEHKQKLREAAQRRWHPERVAEEGGLNREFSIRGNEPVQQ